MKNALAALAGALFGAGLLVSGMTRPEKVIGFLDVTGGWAAWDPALAFVMVGALAVYAVVHRAARRLARPVLDTCFYNPEPTRIDARLIAGAALFGIGWGLAGFCPGPALVAAASGLSAALVFVAAMVAGMLAQHASQSRGRSGTSRWWSDGGPRPGVP